MSVGWELDTMASVHDENGFIIHIWPDDHPPAHVHLYRAECYIKINLPDLSLIQARNAKPRDYRQAYEMVKANREKLLAAWRKYHG